MKRVHIIRIAAEAIVDPRSVYRCYQGAPVWAGTLVRVALAARKLGLPEPARAAEVLPPEPKRAA